MDQEMLDEQKRANTEEVSLDGFIVKETLAGHLLPKSAAKVKRNFGLAELKNIQKRKKSVRSTLRNRFF